jgi:transposase
VLVSVRIIWNLCFGVIYCERTVSKLLAAIGFSRMSARPQHPKQDERSIVTLSKNRPNLLLVL